MGYPMKSHRLVMSRIAGSVIFAMLGHISASLGTEDSSLAPGNTPGSRVEDIYIARSFRESRDKPTNFCSESKTGFGVTTSEDHFTFRSIAIRTSDGKMTDNDVRTIGRIRACFGPTNNPTLQNFY